jgi:hypothetical protein
MTIQTGFQWTRASATVSNNFGPVLKLGIRTRWLGEAGGAALNDR